MTFLREEIPARAFGEWSLAFRDLNTEKEYAAGFDELLNSDRLDLDRFPAKIRAFMKMFSR